MKMLHCCSNSLKYNVPVVTLARPRMTAALKHDFMLLEIPETRKSETARTIQIQLSEMHAALIEIAGKRVLALISISTASF
jgi:hypothetical protein